MKIQIHSASHNLSVWIPSRLIFNSVTATIAGRKIISKAIDDENVKLSPRACRRLFRCINRCRRKNKDWNIVDIRSSNGDEILIKL